MPAGSRRAIPLAQWLDPRQGPAASPLAGESPRSSTHSNELASSEPEPLTRLHALCTLDGFGKLGNATDALVAALRDPHPGLRENALRLAESSDDPDIRTAAFALVEPIPTPRCCSSLRFRSGQWDSPEAGQILAALLAKDIDDPFLVTAAVLSSRFAASRSSPPRPRPASRSQSVPHGPRHRKSGSPRHAPRSRVRFRKALKLSPHPPAGRLP